MTQEVFKNLKFGDKVCVYHPGEMFVDGIRLPTASRAIVVRISENEIRCFSKNDNFVVAVKDVYIYNCTLNQRFQKDMKLMGQNYRSLLSSASAAIQIEITE